MARMSCHIQLYQAVKDVLTRMCNEKVKPVNDQECVLLYAVCGLMETLRSTHWSDELEEYMKSLTKFMTLPKKKDEVADTSRSRWLHTLQQFVLVTDVGHANERYRMGLLVPWCTAFVERDIRLSSEMETMLRIAAGALGVCTGVCNTRIK